MHGRVYINSTLFAAKIQFYMPYAKLLFCLSYLIWLLNLAKLAKRVEKQNSIGSVKTKDNIDSPTECNFW